MVDKEYKIEYVVNAPFKIIEEDCSSYTWYSVFQYLVWKKYDIIDIEEVQETKGDVSKLKKLIKGKKKLGLGQEEKEEIIYIATVEKFVQNEVLKEKLLSLYSNEEEFFEDEKNIEMHSSTIEYIVKKIITNKELGYIM